ncbi:hypothetical protein ACIQY5_19635 [Peribacillus frigoritolerans]|uniref:hypothetical protein n=1 Tax=Peribacillus frigoritolerans TaxID=450367 RepID=UPI00380CF323
MTAVTSEQGQSWKMSKNRQWNLSESGKVEHDHYPLAGNQSWFPASLRGKGWTSFIFS